MTAATGDHAVSQAGGSPALLGRNSEMEDSDSAQFVMHDHLALIYDNQEEQMNIVAPFLRVGMESGAKSVFIVDADDPEKVLAAMGRYGIDVHASRAAGSLSVLTRQEAYLKKGYFDPDWMIKFLAKTVEDAKRNGFQGVYSSGDMTWALVPLPDAANRLVDYECKVDAFFAGSDMVGLCQYNRHRLSPKALMHVIHTHPKLIFRGEVCDNPYYFSPQIRESGRSGTGDPVERLLVGMVEATRMRHHLKTEKEALHRSEKAASAGRMADAMAHEINNPLEAIMNLWYLLKQENLSPEGRDRVKMMGRELNRVSYISNQILGLYSINSVAANVDITQLIQEAVRRCMLLDKAHRTIVKVDSRTNACIDGNANELGQLFENLVTNAIESRAARVRIRVSDSYHWKRPERRGVRITIADNGPGIEAATFVRAFEPFFTTKRRKGAGLGLWVSRRIAQKHDGSITMHTSTRPGRGGTAFSVFLPTR